MFIMSEPVFFVIIVPYSRPFGRNPQKSLRIWKEIPYTSNIRPVKHRDKSFWSHLSDSIILESYENPFPGNSH